LILLIDTRTPMTQAVWEDDKLREFNIMTPWAEWGVVDDIAKTVVFLASDDAAYHGSGAAGRWRLHCSIENEKNGKEARVPSASRDTSRAGHTTLLVPNSSSSNKGQRYIDKTLFCLGP